MSTRFDARGCVRQTMREIKYSQERKPAFQELIDKTVCSINVLSDFTERSEERQQADDGGESAIREDDGKCIE
jgi:hypothetical protein